MRLPLHRLQRLPAKPPPPRLGREVEIVEKPVAAAMLDAVAQCQHAVADRRPIQLEKDGAGRGLIGPAGPTRFTFPSPLPISGPPPLPHLSGGTFEFAVGLTLLLWVRWRPAGPDVAPRGPAAAAADRLGAMSYTLYLLHIPLIVAVGAVLGRLVPLGTPVSFALTLVAVCLLCYPFYRWVERPCIGWRGGAAGTGRPRRTGGTDVAVAAPRPRDPGRLAVRTLAGTGTGRG